MSEKPKILHVEISEKTGGIEAFLLNVYGSIDRSKLQFDFITSGETVECEKQIADLGGRIYKIKYGNILSYYQGLLKLISENGYSIVHIHKNSAANIIPFLACKKAGVKTVIAHSHNTNPSRGKITKVLHYMNRPLLNLLCTNKFACSDLAAIWLFGKKCVTKKEINYIKNGIDIEKYVFNKEIRKCAREQMGIDDNTFLIGNVGKLIAQKNQILLVEILFEVKKQYTNTKLLICGEGSLREKIITKARDLNVEDSLIMQGFCNNVNNMLQAMDVYVMPSLYEGLSVAAIEAQCAGLPTLISDKMSRQTKVIEQCHMISLDVSAREWAMRVIEYKDTERVDTSDVIRKHGYDAKMTANDLQMFYMSKFEIE